MLLVFAVLAQLYNQRIYYCHYDMVHVMYCSKNVYVTGALVITNIYGLFRALFIVVLYSK